MREKQRSSKEKNNEKKGKLSWRNMNDSQSREKKKKMLKRKQRRKMKIGVNLENQLIRKKRIKGIINVS